MRRNWPLVGAVVVTGVFAVAAAFKNWDHLVGTLNGKPPSPPPPPVLPTTGPEVAKGWIGLSVRDRTTSDGVDVAEVFTGGPAAKAEILAGDHIIQMNGETPTKDSIAAKIRQLGPGGVIEFTIEHPSEPVPLTVTVTIESNSGIEALIVRLIEKGATALAAIQSDDGFWPHFALDPGSSVARPGLGSSALAVAALAFAGKDGGEPAHAALERGTLALLTKRWKDGGIHDLEDPMPHRVYANSFFLFALAATKRPELAQIRDWLVRTQVGGEGWGWVDPLDKNYGGWNYYELRDPRNVRTDISTASWALDALAASGLDARSPVWGRAGHFLERSQNWEVLSRTEDDKVTERAYRDGGFAFAPQASKAPPQRVPVGDDLYVYPSYGSATADGVRGLYAASGDDFDRDRREAALSWLARSYTLDRTPGFGDQDYTGWSYGIHYYWLATLARAFHVARVNEIERKPGDGHKWPDELARVLANLQRKDDLWQSNNVMMHEDSPVIATSFAIIALCAARDRVRAKDGRTLVGGAAQPKPPEPPKPWAPGPEGAIARGREVFRSVGCRACHVDRGDPNAPSLVGVADRFLEWKKTRQEASDYLHKHIRDPRSFPGSQADKPWTAQMPAFGAASGVSDAQLDELVEFLLSRFGTAPVSEAER